MPDFGAGGIGPAFGERGVDRLEDGIQPLAQIGAFRHPQRDAGLADLALGAHQPLAHRSRRHQEGRRDGDRVEAEDGLQYQRCAHADVDGRVGAREHQGQAIVGTGGRRPRRLPARPSDADGRRRSRRVCRCRATSISLRRATVSSQASGVLRKAARRPVDEGGGKGLGQRILGPRDVARARGQKRDQLAVAATRNRFGGRARLLRRVPDRIDGSGLHRPRSAAPRSCRGSRPGTAPPRTARRRDRAPRSGSSRRAAPWSRRTGH